MRRFLPGLLGVSWVVALLVAGPRRGRTERPHFDLTVGPSARRVRVDTRSARLERALETIAAGVADTAPEGDAQEDLDRARRAAARAYGADGDVRLAEAQLRAAADGSGESAARARLELAHFARRRGDLGGARVGYLRSLLDVDLPRRAREAAVRAWAGLERDAGDEALGEALRVGLALDARRARDRIRAWSVLVRAREERAPQLASWLRYACMYREGHAGVDEELRERLVAFARSSR